MTAPRLVTFDVYSALVDYEGTLVPVVRDACPGLDAASFVRAWRAKQLEYAQLTNSLPGGRVPFRIVTRRSLDYTIARTGQRVADPERDRWMARWDELDPWPEAQATLATLKARGYCLAMLSNGDEDMLRTLAARILVKFDHIFASDNAGHYKPHPAIYALPATTLGIANDEVLHVAGSANDVLGAKLSGLRCAWSNRAADRLIDPSVTADEEMRDLTGLLNILEPLPQRWVAR